MCLESQCWGGRDGQISGARWPASSAHVANSGPVREPVPETKKVDSAQEIAFNI